ncbi:hypothetical protein QVD99_006786 [Batrachochytrium dendrobatidis]|nr:hypothetical protein QVD99_006786 [Batrachochytrium dendrobatidis]
MAEHDDNIDACSQDPIDDIQDQLSEPIEGEEMQVVSTMKHLQYDASRAPASMITYT